MTKLTSILFLWPAMLLFDACSSTGDTRKPPSPVPVESKETLYRKGHSLFLEAEYDSASSVLGRSLTLDSAYLPALKDLAEMNYILAAKDVADPVKQGHLKRAQRYYERIEALSQKDSDVYERLCEIAHAIGDDSLFLKYSKKNADAYPSDRQYFNLGIAYFGVNDFQNVIKVQKLAIERFKSSPFIGSFYKQLGRAYMKVDRDQTAERTFATGVQVVDARLVEIRKSRTDYKSADDYRRLLDDKIGMLLFLKKLHQIYDAKEKLEEVERKLKEAEYSR